MSRARAPIVPPLVALLAAIAGAARAGDVPRLQDRQTLFNALVAAHVLDPDRQLVHLSHVCTLKIDGASFPVADVHELVPGAMVPRGVNRIIVLDAKLAPVRSIEYTTERPLFCKDRRLFVFGDLAVDGLDPGGDVLVFSDNGRSVKVEQMDFNELPLPRTGGGKAAPQ